MLPDLSSAVNIPARIAQLRYATNIFVDFRNKLVTYSEPSRKEHGMKALWNSNLVDALALVAALYILFR